ETLNFIVEPLLRYLHRFWRPRDPAAVVIDVEMRPADPVMRWGFRILVRHLFSIADGVFFRHLRAPTDASRSDNPVYRDPPTLRLGRVFDFVVAVAVGLVYLPAWIAILVLVSMFYLIAQLPSWLLIVGPAAALQQA